jgi:tetratricopeptide (TPR) repeat protein
MQLSTYAQDTNTLFVDANKLYQQEKFNEAIELYHKIENLKEVSAEMYYNLANAYYKTNKVAPSIYYFEKALQLNPNNKDIKFNLGFAKRMTIDNIEKMPTTLFQKLSQNIIQKLTYNSWAYIAVFFMFLFATLFLMYHFYYSSSKKRLLFVLSNISILGLIICLLFAFHTYKVTGNKKEAIIFAQQTTIKNAPILSSNDVFELHEGTKVQILESVDNWKKIKIADGQTGWIIASELKEL